PINYLLFLPPSPKSTHDDTHFFVPLKVPLEGTMTKLTDAFIRNLQVPEDAKDVQAFDDVCPGFGVRKQRSGHATFFVKYSTGKQQRRKTLGAFVPGALAAIRRRPPWSWPRQGWAPTLWGTPRRRGKRLSKPRRWASLCRPISNSARGEMSSGKSSGP